LVCPDASPLKPTSGLSGPPAARPFRTFFSCATGFGTIALDLRLLRIDVVEGQLVVEKLVLTRDAKTETLDWRANVHPGTPAIRELVPFLSNRARQAGKLFSPISPCFPAGDFVTTGPIRRLLTTWRLRSRFGVDWLPAATAVLGINNRPKSASSLNPFDRHLNQYSKYWGSLRVRTT
jgi:hypothetical protein